MIYNQQQFFSGEKIHFIKTHSNLNEYKGNSFTTENLSLGGIYIVRDPRNLITSMTHHYSLNYDQAYLKIINKNQTLLEKSTDADYSNFTFFGSWSSHYKSWKNTNDFKTLFIKYEDLENNKFDTFKKIVKFINTLKNEKQSIDEKKLINSINSTHLFTSVCDSFGILAPMLHGGCFKSSSSVTPVKSLKAFSLKGPPEAVIRILEISLRFLSRGRH